MAGAPGWKVYDAQGRYQAACKEIEAAASLVAFYGDGATIRFHHGIVVWREGESGDGSAAESYDNVAEVAHRRVKERIEEQRKKRDQAVQERLSQVRVAGG